MQDGAGGDIHLLLGILADGEEQARQLDARLGEPDDDMLLPQPRAEAECCRRGLARQLRFTFGKAMAVARAIESAAGAGGSGSRGTDDRSDSPRSADESSGGTARDAQAQEPRGMCKRRKGLPRWTQKFRLLDTNLEYSPDDGFSWRKYGQKDILGAKFPRGYYRCTYRNAQGCPATKQVQRSDSDLTVFDVTYQGVHTCHQKQRRPASPPAPVAAPVDAAHDGNHPPPPPQDRDVQLLESFKNSLKVETDGPAAAPSFHDHVDHDHGTSTAAFSFPSVPPFHNAAAAGGFSQVESGQQLGGGFSPAFVSPAAASAGSSYFSSVAHCPADTRGAEPSELGEVVSAATASAVDPAGFDYSLYQYGYQYHHAELDPHLPFAPLFDHHSHGQFRDA